MDSGVAPTASPPTHGGHRRRGGNVSFLIMIPFLLVLSVLFLFVLPMTVTFQPPQHSADSYLWSDDPHLYSAESPSAVTGEQKSSMLRHRSKQAKTVVYVKQKDAPEEDPMSSISEIEADILGIRDRRMLSGQRGDRVVKPVQASSAEEEKSGPSEARVDTADNTTKPLPERRKVPRKLKPWRKANMTDGELAAVASSELECVLPIRFDSPCKTVRSEWAYAYHGQDGQGARTTRELLKLIQRKVVHRKLHPQARIAFVGDAFLEHLWNYIRCELSGDVGVRMNQHLKTKLQDNGVSNAEAVPAYTFTTPNTTWTFLRVPKLTPGGVAYQAFSALATDVDILVVEQGLAFPSDELPTFKKSIHAIAGTLRAFRKRDAAGTGDETAAAVKWHGKGSDGGQWKHRASVPIVLENPPEHYPTSDPSGSQEQFRAETKRYTFAEQQRRLDTYPASAGCSPLQLTRGSSTAVNGFLRSVVEEEQLPYVPLHAMLRGLHQWHPGKRSPTVDCSTYCFNSPVYNVAIDSIYRAVDNELSGSSPRVHSKYSEDEWFSLPGLA